MAEIVTTIKGGGEAPWIVVHSDSVEESEALLSQIAGGLSQTAVEAGQVFSAAFRAGNGAASNVPPNGGQQQPQQNQWQQNNGAGGNQWNQGGGDPFIGSPNPEGKSCQLCGSLLIGKKPKVKRMWSCPNQRTQGDGHTVEWING